MTGRHFAVGLAMVSFAALGFGAIISACFSPPQPACGFACGTSGVCPADYTCNQADMRCHLNGSPMMACGAVDAGSPVEGVVLFDAMPDTSIVDSFVIPDAPPIDAEMIDAGVDAMADAQVDAMADAQVDAMLDAAVDAMDDAAIDAATTDASVDAPPVADAPDDSAPGTDAPDPDAGVPTD